MAIVLIPAAELAVEAVIASAAIEVGTAAALTGAAATTATVAAAETTAIAGAAVATEVAAGSVLLGPFAIVGIALAGGILLGFGGYLVFKLVQRRFRVARNIENLNYPPIRLQLPPN